MLSWLERGLPQPDTSGEIVEFLVAPFQSKGADRSSTKAWVDRIYRDRESQEMRRILYVAATRARDELHLFARPSFKTENDGALNLAEPEESLLSTAWPALEEEIQRRFAVWNAAQSEAESSTIESLAAAGESNLLVMPAPLKSTPLRRLPPDYMPPRLHDSIATPAAPGLAFETWESQLYTRHEGGLLSRALGIAVHTLLENLARLRTTNDWEQARAALKQFQPRIAAQIRAAGIDPSQASAIAAEALRIALDSSRDPLGQWILSPHPQAAAEARWTGVAAGTLRTVQVDRLFRAGLEPQSAGDAAWWIVDYKTAHADALAPANALPQLRAAFAPQLEAYAEILRKLHGNHIPIRAGLYYPRMLLFDWWEL
jgi:ATP-dependent exoDNAse (exonuclease V) beta subunit